MVELTLRSNLLLMCGDTVGTFQFFWRDVDVQCDPSISVKKLEHFASFIRYIIRG